MVGSIELLTLTLSVITYHRTPNTHKKQSQPLFVALIISTLVTITITLNTNRITLKPNQGADVGNGGFRGAEWDLGGTNVRTRTDETQRQAGRKHGLAHRCERPVAVITGLSRAERLIKSPLHEFATPETPMPSPHIFRVS